MSLFDRLLTCAGSVVRWYYRRRPVCPICSRPIEADQLTAVWRVEHLGGLVRVHRFCRPEPERCELGGVVRT